MAPPAMRFRSWRSYGMLKGQRRSGAEAVPLNLTEVAEALAQNMKCQVEPSDDPFEVRVNGNGYHFIVAPFFGGWQATLHIPGKPPVIFYGEAVDMLESRLKAKLSGRDANF